MKTSIAILIAWLTLSTNSFSCTSFLLRTINDYTIYGRTMEWGAFDLKSELVVVPRQQKYTSKISAQTSGMKWANKYGFVAINAVNQPYVTDGMNELGLSVGVLYFPGFADYQAFDIKLAPNSIANVDLAAYILGNFTDTASIKKTLPTLRVVYNKALDDAFGAPTPLHLIVTDKSGKSIVIEYLEKKLHIFDNDIGVMTNAPAYDWHLLNLRNYPTLSPQGISEPKTLNGIDISPFGAGSGMFGLPGDITPPSRFIRAVAYTHTSTKLTTPDIAISQASRILNNFDIPKGLVREGPQQNFHLNYTQWSVIADLKRNKYYYWTEFNRRMRVIDLNKVNWSMTKPVALPLDKKREEDIEEIIL